MDYHSLLSAPEYNFLFTNPHLGNNVTLLGLGGSHAYGTNIEGSDIDIRGIALNSKQNILTRKDFEQVSDSTTDTTIYSFDKFVQLATACNPNVIEILGLKPEHYLILGDAGQILLDNRHLFLSKQAANSFGGYASAQLRRLDNKAARKVSQTEQEEHIKNSIAHIVDNFSEKYTPFPEDSICLFVAPSTKPGMDSEIFTTIHLTNYPLRDFGGMLSEMREVINSYGKSMGKRNEHAASHGKLGKHSMHLVRLFYMAFDILEKGEINTYREKEHDLLMDIRNGKYLDENDQVKPEFFEMVDELEARLAYDKEHSLLPDKPDKDGIERMVERVNEAIVYGVSPLSQEYEER